MDEFKVGDYVGKTNGYPFFSFVVAVFNNRAGDQRLVCESTVIPGMLHIFNPSQMHKIEIIDAKETIG